MTLLIMTTTRQQQRYNKNYQLMSSQVDKQPENTKVESSWFVHKFKCSHQNSFSFYKQDNIKIEKNILATAFEFGMH